MELLAGSPLPVHKEQAGRDRKGTGRDRKGRLPVDKKLAKVFLLQLLPRPAQDQFTNGDAIGSSFLLHQVFGALSDPDVDTALVCCSVLFAHGQKRKLLMR